MRRAEPSIFWYSLALPYSGHMLWNLVHVHAKWLLWFDIYSAKPEQLGLNVGRFLHRVPWEPLPAWVVICDARWRVSSANTP